MGCAARAGDARVSARVDVDRELAAIAASRHGIVTHREARANGLSQRQLDYRVQTGRLVRVHPGVYAVGGAPRTFEQRVLAAVLASGAEALASHGSASVVWSLRGSEPEPRVEITTPRERLPQVQRVRHHRSAVLTDRDRAVVHEIPVTSVPRTLVDLSASRGIGWLARAMDDAMRRNLALLPDFRECANRLTGAPGRRPSVVRLLVDERFAIGGGRTESWLERVVLGILLDAGIEEPVPQHWVTVDGHRYRLDLAWPDKKIALEADGFGAHSSYGSFHDDRRRDLRLRRVGWDVLHVTGEMTAEEIVGAVDAALEG